MAAGIDMNNLINATTIGIYVLIAMLIVSTLVAIVVGVYIVKTRNNSYDKFISKREGMSQKRARDIKLD